MNRGLWVFDQRWLLLLLTKRSAASGGENANLSESKSINETPRSLFFEVLCLNKSNFLPVGGPVLQKRNSNCVSLENVPHFLLREFILGDIIRKGIKVAVKSVFLTEE